MRKRFTGFLVTLAMVLAVFPAVPALAAAPTTVEVAGTDVTAGGYWKTTAGGKLEAGDANNWNVHYQAGTLYLQDANVAGVGTYQDQENVDAIQVQAALYAKGGELTISVAGDCSVTGILDEDNPGNYKYTAGIYGQECQMTISGDANSVLTVHSGVLNTGWEGKIFACAGILVHNAGKLTLDTEGTIRTYGGKIIRLLPKIVTSAGIYVFSDDNTSPELEVRNGDIFAYASGRDREGFSDNSNGIWIVSRPTESITGCDPKYTQSGGNVWAQGGGMEGVWSSLANGILLDFNTGSAKNPYVTITGGTLTAIAKEDGAWCSALSAVNCKMKISGDAVVKLQANGTNSNTSGIDFAIPSNIGSYNASMQVEGGSLTVESNGVAIQMIQENGKYI